MLQKGVKLAAAGMVHCLGMHKEEIYPKVLAGDQSAFTMSDKFIPNRVVPVGAVSGELPQVPAELSKHASRTGQLAVSAFKQFEDSVQAAIKSFGRERVGVVLGTSTSGITVGEEAVREYVQQGELKAGYKYSQQEPGAAGEFLAEYCNVGGPAFTVSTACSSSSKALSSAMKLLHSGICDAVIAGGADSLCRLSLNGFSALELLSDSICNPMSKNRKGITIGEGACLFLLTREEGGVRLLGAGESSDAYHISAPDPEGKGVMLAIERALKAANLKASDINYVNLHGTGTLQNDAMESKAVSQAFGDSVPCSSTKGLVGHTLGAAGAIEAGFCWLALSQAKDRVALPPHCFDGVRDDALARINLVKQGDSIPATGQVVMLSNSFAFGGSNCVVILGKDFTE